MRRPVYPVAVALVAALGLSACGGGDDDGGSASSDGDRTLVVDTSFQLTTSDPARMFEPTGQIVDHVIYETLFTFEGTDSTTPIPLIATGDEVSADGLVHTMTLRDDVTFSDGTPMTADDVVFSLNRVAQVKGNPSFLMDGVTVAKVDDTTITLTTATPDPALPFKLTNPALGVVNSAAVTDEGGSADPGADTADTAEDALNGESQGSGPYVLDTFDVQDQVVLVKNPDYWGDEPTYDRIVLRNTEASVQSVNVRSGDSQLVLDLSADQAAELGGDVTVDSSASANVFFVYTNNDPAVSPITSNPGFQEAVRYGIDYDALVELAGEGASQTPGVIPTTFLGALDAGDAVARDVDRAKAALAGSGIADPSVTMSYPSDVQVNGIDFGDLAAAVQQQLAEVGITLELAPAPVQTALEGYRGGTEQMGLWSWGPDYPDPSDYLVFTPGQLVGLRAGWAAGADPELETAATAVASEFDDDARAEQYTSIQQRLNEVGPFYPLIQPAQVLAYSSSLEGVAFNPSWTVDLADLG
jgi:peptide/nickel transport system substrate-binding protein